MLFFLVACVHFFTNILRHVWSSPCSLQFSGFFGLFKREINCAACGCLKRARVGSNLNLCALEWILLVEIALAWQDP
jgi:hypothetical protein